MEFTIPRGKVSCVVANRGTGKTWLTLGFAAEFLKEGEEVTWFCFECGGDTGPDPYRCMTRLYQRLGLLGVADNQRMNRFWHYPNPPAKWWPFKLYETSEMGLVVFDGMCSTHDPNAYVMPFHTSVPTATVMVTMCPRTGVKVPEFEHSVAVPGGGETVSVLGTTEINSLTNPPDNTFRIV